MRFSSYVRGLKSLSVSDICLFPISCTHGWVDVITKVELIPPSEQLHPHTQVTENLKSNQLVTKFSMELHPYGREISVI